MFSQDLQRDYQSLFRFALLCFDILFTIIAGILAYHVRFHHFTLDYRYWQVLGLAAALSIIVFRSCGLYEALREKRFFTYILQGTLAIALVFGILSIFGVISKSSVHYSRIWVGYWLLILWLGFMLSRLSSYGLVYLLRLKGINIKRIVVIGNNLRATSLIETLKKSPWSGVRPVYCFSETAVETNNISGVRIKPLVLSRLQSFVRRAKIDEVWIVLSLQAEPLIKAIADSLIHESIAVRYVPDGLGLSFRRHLMTEISGYPLINVYATPLTGVKRWLKAIEDRGLALLFLFLASPFMLLIAIAIKTSSKGPILFKQQRHGWNGKKFMVYKFRSMLVHQESPGIVSQAKKKDARITPLGRFLRRTSLDELPQLLNVLKGDMSIVGPRPHAVEHNEYYKTLVTSYMQRFRMKPGITGWAQVNGYRGETDTLEKMQRRIDYDLYYIENWSLLFDIKIIFLTFWRGFFHKNAY